MQGYLYSSPHIFASALSAYSSNKHWPFTSAQGDKIYTLWKIKEIQMQNIEGKSQEYLNYSIDILKWKMFRIYKLFPAYSVPEKWSECLKISNSFLAQNRLHFLGCLFSLTVSPTGKMHEAHTMWCRGRMHMMWRDVSPASLSGFFWSFPFWFPLLFFYPFLSPLLLTNEAPMISIKGGTGTVFILSLISEDIRCTRQAFVFISGYYKLRISAVPAGHYLLLALVFE